MWALHLFLALALLYQEPFGIVTGHIENEDGSPAVGILVAAMRHSDPELPGVTALIRLTETDDHGSYTLDRIPPGMYDIVAGPRHAPTFYPGTPLADRSSTLRVAPGSRFADISFSMKDLFVRGRVAEGGTGLPAIGAWVTLRTDGNTGAPPREALVKADGSFEFRSLAPGSYELEARYEDFVPRHHSFVIGAEGIENVLMDFGVARLHGRLVGFDRVPLAVTSPGAVALSQGADWQTLRSVVPIRADGVFDVRVDAGQYALTLYSLLDDYFVKAIRYGNRDLLNDKLDLQPGTDAELEIMLGDRPQPGEIPVRGDVRDAISNGPSTADKVTLCCATGTVRRLSALIHDDGSFQFRGVPPGTYTVGMEGPTDFWPFVQLVNVRGDSIEGVHLLSNPYVLEISGTVSAENGGNLSSARMSLEFRGKEEDFTIPTGSGGVFGGTLPEGEYHVCLLSSRSDYYVKSITAGSRNLLQEMLRIDGHAQSKIAITLAFRLPEPPGVRAKGRVPIQGVTTVTLETQALTLKADVGPDGEFEFLHLTPDCYTGTLLSSTEPRSFRVFVGDEDIEDLQIDFQP